MLHRKLHNTEVSALDDRSWLGVRGRAPSTTPMTSCLTRAFEAEGMGKTFNSFAFALASAQSIFGYPDGVKTQQLSGTAIGPIG